MRTLRKKLAVFVVLPIATLAVLVFAASWYLSGLIGCRGFKPIEAPAPPDVEVVSQESTVITLRNTGIANECGAIKDVVQKPGIWGLTWPGGYAHVGPVRSVDDGRGEVVRDFTPVGGTPPPGTLASLTYPFPVDPMQAHRIPFTEVSYRSPLGQTPAWLTEGKRDTWVIFVHGKGAKRTEAMRVLKTVSDLDFPGLVITYRNDSEAPRAPTGAYQYGRTEWEDLEAAVGFALDAGARDVILVGYSMGGAIVASFLFQSNLAENVRSVILDAPMLDFGATVDLGIKEFGLPGIAAGPPKWIASWRYNIDWAAMDYVSRASELRTPVLLLHGAADDIVPVSIGDQFAAARPDLITYERFETAHHVTSWNVDPQRYERALREFFCDSSRHNLHASSRNREGLQIHAWITFRSDGMIVDV